jgi:putative transposase
VLIEHGSRRLVHFNITRHPTAAWTLRRECLDRAIPVSEGHLRWILKSWVEHNNRGRPHRSLGPGVPDPPEGLVLIRNSESRHQLEAGALVRAQSVLSGLHHEYLLVPARA